MGNEKKLRAVIVDDEPKAIANLKEELATNCDHIEIISEFTNSVLAVKEIPNLNPDILFLDVKMPVMDGFDVLARVPYKNFKVIFVSAYEAYALRAWKLNALDFLVKPIVPKELVDAVAKAAKNETLNKEQWDIIQGEKQGNISDRIGVHDNYRTYYIKFEDILYIEASDNYCGIFRKDVTKHLIPRTLSNIQDVFEETHFLRVHRSYIINLRCVQEFISAERLIIMSDGKQIPVSRDKLDDFNSKWRIL